MILGLWVFQVHSDLGLSFFHFLVPYMLSASHRVQLEIDEPKTETWRIARLKLFQLNVAAFFVLFLRGGSWVIIFRFKVVSANFLQVFFQVSKRVLGKLGKLFFYVTSKALFNLEKFKVYNIRDNEAVVQKCSVKRCSKNFAKFTGKHLCQSLVFSKVAGLLWHRCFPVNFVRFLRTPFFTPLDDCFCRYSNFMT